MLEVSWFDRLTTNGNVGLTTTVSVGHQPYVPFGAFRSRTTPAVNRPATSTVE